MSSRPARKPYPASDHDREALEEERVSRTVENAVKGAIAETEIDSDDRNITINVQVNYAYSVHGSAIAGRQNSCR